MMDACMVHREHSQSVHLFAAVVCLRAKPACELLTIRVIHKDMTLLMCSYPDFVSVDGVDKYNVLLRAVALDLECDLVACQSVSCRIQCQQNGLVLAQT